MHRAGPWSREQVDDFLASARTPMRLAGVSSEGWPVIASLWYQPGDGELWCATPARSGIARLLAREPRCGFEIAVNEPPYRGVRGRGRARLEADRGDEVLAELVERYLGSEPTSFTQWLLGRAVEEVAICVEVDRLTSWDFGERMGG